MSHLLRPRLERAVCGSLDADIGLGLFDHVTQTRRDTHPFLHRKAQAVRLRSTDHRSRELLGKGGRVRGVRGASVDAPDPAHGTDLVPV